MVAATEVAVIRTAQSAIADAVEAELRAFFATLDLGRPEAARNALLEYTPALVDEYGENAAVFAAEWYDEIRAAERVPGAFRARPAPLTESARVEGRVRSSATHLFDGPGELTLTALLDSVNKFVLEPGRATIVDSAGRDPRASGWRRVARVGSCDFCRMLAGRDGAVYKERTASFAAHGSCRCASVPSWDPDAREVDVGAYEASKRMTDIRRRVEAGDPVAIRRLEDHRASVRDWVKANLD